MKLLGLSTQVKFVSDDWPFLDPPGISEPGSDLKTSLRGIIVRIRPV